MVSKSLIFIGKKKVLSVNDAKSVWYLWKKYEPCFLSHKLWFEFDDRTNLKRKKVRLLEENTEYYIHDPEEGKHLLSRI